MSKSIKKLAKELSGTVKVKQFYERKMSSEELQEYLKMKRSGSSTTKNGKAYSRKEKHKNLRVA